MPDKKIFGNTGPDNPDLPLSTFDKSFTNNLSARFGRVYPVLVDMACPHSTYHITPHVAFDMMPTVSPVQANIRCHVSYYKVPLRILMRNYQDFFSRVGDHKLPYIKRTENWCETGSLADYMGIPSQRYQADSSESGLNFGRYGYTKFGYLNGKDVVGLPFGQLFHQSLINAAPSSPVDNSDFNVIGAKLDQPLADGVISLPFFISNTDTVPTNSSFQGYSLELLALKVSRFEQTLPESVNFGVNGYSFDVATTYKRGQILQCVNGHLGRDNDPASGTSYPYADLEPGKFALDNAGFVTRTTSGYSYKQGRFVFRLSDNFLSELNNMFESQIGSDVFLLVGWSTRSTAEALFGQNSKLFPSVSLATHVGLSAPIVTTQTTGQTTKENVSDILMEFQPPYRGLNGLGSCRYLQYYNKAGEENPFVAQVVDGQVQDPKLPISAFAFRAYEFLHNYFFRNERVDPFMKLDPETGEMVETYNQFITNDGDGADSTTPVDFFTAPYEYDLFTTCQKSPQFGNAPLVGITTNDSGDTADILMRGQRLLDNGQTENFDYTISVKLGDDARILQISNYDEVADKTSVMRLNEAIRYGISINDFRSVNAFQIMQERFLKAGYQYKDLVKEFFGTTAPVGENYPEYLGGITREVSVSKIQNLAKSSDAALGEFAGTGQVSGHGERVECFCSEWSIIMGLMWFSVTPVYSQHLDKHFLYNSYLDFYNPALMSIGPQPVYKYQLAPLQLPRDANGKIDEEHLYDVFGYNRPWSDMVSRQDEAHGEFRSTMYSYLLQRLFYNAPSLGHDFLHMDPSDLTDIFSYMVDTDKFYGAIRHEMFVKMPMPKVSLPRII